MSIYLNMSLQNSMVDPLDITIRLATAHDRNALDEFYAREGMSFKAISTRAVCYGSMETMFLVAVTDDVVIAAMKLDIARDPKLGMVGYIQFFEIEDKFESTDLGTQMLSKLVEIADQKNLVALDATVNEERKDLVSMFLANHFEVDHKEVYLRRKFKPSVF